MRKWNKWVGLGIAGVLVLGCTACGAGNDSGEKDGSQYVGTVLEDGSSADSDTSSEESSEGNEEPGSEEGMAISQDEVTLLYGRGTSLDVYGVEGDIAWENDHPDIVEMEENGTSVMITGQKTGEATITAKASDETVSCHVKVVFAGLYLKDDRENAGAYSSGTYNLGSSHTYKVFYDADEIASSDVKWKSFDENIVTVSDGNVKMAGEGMTYISAEDSKGNIAYASVWVSDTDEEYETKIPGKGLFIDGKTAYEEHVLMHTDTEETSLSVDDVYDDGEKIDAESLGWSVEDTVNHPFELSVDGTELEITYTQQAGSAFLVAENPSTGHTFRYLVVVIDA